MVACSEEQSTQNSELTLDQLYKIAFSTSVESRAGAIDDLETALDPSFTVEAYIHQADLDSDTESDDDYVRIMRTEVNYVDGSWTPDDDAYWPTGSGMMVDFYAWHGADHDDEDDDSATEHTQHVTVSPNGESIKVVYDARAITRLDGDDNLVAPKLFKKETDSGSETVAKVGCIESGDEIESLDLMYAKTLNCKNPTDQALDGESVNYTTKLEFKHILTHVDFEFKTQEIEGGFIQAKVKAMTLHNIKSGRTFASVVTYDDGRESLYDHWYIDTDENGDPIQSVTLPNYFCVPIDWSATLFPDSSDAVAYDPGASSVNDLMLIPQELKAWDSYSYTIEENDKNTYGAYLRVYCDLYLGETKLFGDEAVLSSSESAVELPDDYCVFFPIVSTGTDGTNLWQCGNKVTYTIYLGSGYDNSGNQIISGIDVDATLTPWVTENFYYDL